MLSAIDAVPGRRRARAQAPVAQTRAAPRSSSSPTSSTPPPSPNAWATPRSARGHAALDDALRAHHRATTAARRSMAKTLGDGVLATFPAASQAIDCGAGVASAGGRAARLAAARRHPRRRRDPRGRQRVRRRGEHRCADQRALRAGRGAGVGHVRSLARTSAGVTLRRSRRARAQGQSPMPQRVFAVRQDGGMSARPRQWC